MGRLCAVVAIDLYAAFVRYPSLFELFRIISAMGKRNLLFNLRWRFAGVCARIAGSQVGVVTHDTIV